jgi:hypothetical protein
MMSGDYLSVDRIRRFVGSDAGGRPLSLEAVTVLSIPVLDVFNNRRHRRIVPSEERGWSGVLSVIAMLRQLSLPLFLWV